LAARRITHPNVVRLHDVGEDKGLHFISMEYVEGESLGTRISRSGPLSPVEACDVAEQICGALEAAHGVGVVHRDLKPHNVLVDPRGKYRVIDFGIAKLPYLEGMTATGVIVGTPEYMAPEQILGGEVDERADLYALGTILYECLTGEAPYRAQSAIAVGFAHCHEAIPSVRAKRPELGEEWEEFFEKALAKEPRERFESAEDMRAALPA
jgi:serine/threonine-protein kinase